MSAEKWQIALRKQVAEELPFRIENMNGHEVFSDFRVYNPKSGNHYKVAIRSGDDHENFCSCMDFKTNGLGTCKHIEAVLHKLKKKRDLARLLKTDYNPPYSSVYLHYLDGRKVKIRIGTDYQKEFSDLAKGYFDEDNELKQDAFDRFETFLKCANEISPDFRCYEDALDYILDIRDQKRRERFMGENADEEFWNSLLKVKLYPYQKEGITFAVKSGRTLIADDMGLGKTLQAIGVAEVYRTAFGISKVLIVSPTSLKYQWEAEIKKFSNATVGVIEGMVTKRRPQYLVDESFFKVVSYNTACNDVETIQMMEPDLIILDEAQRIKNWRTKIAQNIKKLNSRYCVVLTGTPLENKLEELYSLMQFVDHFRLGPMYRFLTDHQVTNEETGKIIGYKDLNNIGKMLEDVVVRRLKKEVLDQLPERVDKNLFVPMTKQQAEMHEEFQDMVAKLASKWRRMGFLSEKDRQRLLLGLSCMRMVCDSTYILDQETRHDTKIDELMSILEEVFDQGEKVVIFSQWERMTRLVSHELDNLEVKYEYLHGGVPSTKRKELFENFNNDKDCLVFLSTDAGGVGLNLQAASVLINLDIPWNPAVIEQRIARIHRMGQKKNVNIINLVSRGTIEERMLDVLKFKSSMAGGVLDKGDDVIFMDEDRFSNFMKSVESLTEEKPEAEKSFIDEEDKEQLAGQGSETNGKEKPGGASEKDEKMKKEPSAGAASETEQPGTQLSFFGDDDIPKQPEEKRQVAAGSVERPEPIELLSQGLQFFGQLGEILSDPVKTGQMVESLTEVDKKTGQTYLKIPVSDQNTVANALKGLSALASMFGRKN